MLLQFIETSLHIVRTKWYEKTQRKFAHLEGGQGQTFRFTLCPLVEMVLLCFTQWQNYSCWQGPPEAQPWSQPDCSELHLSLLGCGNRTWPKVAQLTWVLPSWLGYFHGEKGSSLSPVWASHVSACAAVLLLHTTVKSLTASPPFTPVSIRHTVGCPWSYPFS